MDGLTAGDILRKKTLLYGDQQFVNTVVDSAVKHVYECYVDQESP